jgi:hypothetical protein
MTVQAVYMGGETSIGDYSATLQHAPNCAALSQAIVYNSSARVETESSGLR